MAEQKIISATDKEMDMIGHQDVAAYNDVEFAKRMIREFDER